MGAAAPAPPPNAVVSTANNTSAPPPPQSAFYAPGAAIPPSALQFHETSLRVWAEHAARALAWMRAHPAPTQMWTDVADPHATGLALLIEPRADPMLEFTLRNAAQFLAPHGWALMIMHGTENAEYVRACASNAAGDGSCADADGTIPARVPWPRVAFHSLEVPNLEGAVLGYAHMLTQPSFWRSLPPHLDRVLLFQPDGQFFAPLRRDHPALAYDYVGAPWSAECFVCGTAIVRGVGCCGRKSNEAGVHATAPELVGNGGLSIRGRAAHIAACERFAMGADRFLEVGDTRTRVAGLDAEDVFFALTIPRTGGTVAPRAVAATFAIEQTLPSACGAALTLTSPWAVGMHKVYGYQTVENVRRMLAAYTMTDPASGEVWRDEVLARATRPCPLPHGLE